MGNTKSNLKLNLIDDKRVGEQLLFDAERIDFYLDSCRNDLMNTKARKRQVYAVNSISSKDAAYYQSYLNEIIPRLPMRLQIDLQHVAIIPLMPSADGGMPHTRPYSSICIPQLHDLISTTTMIHELWHLHQKKYKETWSKVFEQLGWGVWGGLLPTFLEKYRRINPDTMDEPLWIYQDTWIPVPIFQDISQPSVTDVTIWFYNVKEGYHIKQVPPIINEAFPGLPKPAYEHPREITAYILADHRSFQNTHTMNILLSLLGHLAISSS